jgi:predicted amidohydrolase YtcJ
VGSDRDIAPLAEAADRVIDVRGHRILPGLQDSHIHAGLTWDSEMHWESIRSVNGALASVRARAAQAQPGEWIARQSTAECRTCGSQQRGSTTTARDRD